MNTEDFTLFANLLKQKSGLSLNSSKIYLLESRLIPVAMKYQCRNLEELAIKLRGSTNADLITDIVEAMTTNETLFFRDDRPFRHLRASLLPELLKAREQKKTLRIWSAACSTGQEAYSIAMILHDLLQSQPGWAIDIIATDIADNVIEKAKTGIYTLFEIQRGLPAQMMVTHFTRNNEEWQIHEKFRNMVRFQNFNLMQDMQKLGNFDIIFCRNVLIYFDELTKKSVLQNLSRRLAPDGYLLLGGAESALCAPDHLSVVDNCPGLYRPFTAQTATMPITPQQPGITARH